MKGSFFLFEQALTACAKAHGVEAHLNQTNHNATLAGGGVPLLSDLRMICEAIFGNRNLVLETGDFGPLEFLTVRYGQAVPLEKVDETSLMLALPRGTRLEPDEQDYLKKHEEERKRDMETVAGIIEKYCRNPEDALSVYNRFLYGVKRCETTALIRAIRKYGRKVYVNDYDSYEDYKESYEKEEGYTKLGTEIDLTAVPKKFRTVLFNTRQAENFKFFNGLKDCIASQEPVTAYLDRIAEVDGGLEGSADDGETIIRLSIELPDGKKKVEYHNDYGSSTVELIKGQIESILDTIRYNDFLKKAEEK